MNKTKNAFKRKEIFKFLLIRILQPIIKMVYIFPINNRRIVFHSYRGDQYSCNPKAISSYLTENYPNQFEMVWLYNDKKKFLQLKNEGIRLVKYKSIKRIIMEATAVASINNIGGFSWIPIRKGQIHVNTWHGGGCYKKIIDNEWVKKTKRETSKQTSCMLSSCSLFTKHEIIEGFGYDKLILEIGSPRNDIFFDSEKFSCANRRVRNKYKICEDDFVVMYAPTWGFDRVLVCPDFSRIKSSIYDKFGRNCVVLTRAHHDSNMKLTGDIDVYDYPDMQELLCATDMLISDYSSTIWDYSFTYKPCILYVPDLEDYLNKTGFYSNIYSWGFPVCKTNEEINEVINTFDYRKFKEKMEKHHKIFGSFEKGNASEAFCKYLLQTINENRIINKGKK